MNSAVFGERCIKLITTGRRRNYLVLERNYHTTYCHTFFVEHISAIEMKKTEVLMNKSIYLGLSIL